MKSYSKSNIYRIFKNSNRYNYKNRGVIIRTNINLHMYIYVNFYLTNRAIKAYGRFHIKFYERHYRVGIS